MDICCSRDGTSIQTAIPGSVEMSYPMDLGQWVAGKSWTWLSIFGLARPKCRARGVNDAGTTIPTGFWHRNARGSIRTIKGDLTKQACERPCQDDRCWFRRVRGIGWVREQEVRAHRYAIPTARRDGAIRDPGSPQRLLSTHPESLRHGQCREGSVITAHDMIS